MNYVFCDALCILYIIMYIYIYILFLEYFWQHDPDLDPDPVFPILWPWLYFIFFLWIFVRGDPYEKNTILVNLVEIHHNHCSEKISSPCVDSLNGLRKKSLQFEWTTGKTTHFFDVFSFFEWTRVGKNIFTLNGLFFEWIVF